jgi:hypothetical protein
VHSPQGSFKHIKSLIHESIMVIDMVINLPGMGSQQQYLVVGVQKVSPPAVAGNPYDEQHQNLL